MELMIGIPAMSWVYTDFMLKLLAMDTPHDSNYMIVQNSLIYDSRNGIAAHAIEEGCDRLLWLDSDMSFEPDLYRKLSEDMDTLGCEYVAGLYCSRNEQRKPCVYKDISWSQENGRISVNNETFYDHPKDKVFECAGTGFGAVLTKTSLLKRMWEKYGAPFYPMPYLGEDLSFCWRVARMGVKMYCDSRINVGHIGTKVYREE